jgi:hypothetical protein
MSRTSTDLRNAFNNAVAIFNAHEDTTIAGSLDDNVTINTYDHKPYSGITAVEGYFAQEYTRNAKFSPAITSVVVSGNTGKVKGTGNWISTNHQGAGVNFNFEFQFVYDSKWLILNMDCYK